MAHIFVIARGHQDRLNRWKNEIMAQYFTYDYRDPKDKNKKKTGAIQTVIRPIELLEIIVPESSLDIMLRTIKCDQSWHHWLQKYAFWLRKILKLDKIDFKRLPEGSQRAIYHGNLEIIPIGIKKDEKKDGVERV